MIRRHLVLDNEAASALVSHRASDDKRKAVVLAITASNGTCVVPSAVRVEVGWDRTASAAASANQLVGADDALDKNAANRAVRLRLEYPKASVVDVAVAVAAERVGARDDLVEVLTSDVVDMTVLAGLVNANVVVQAV